MLLTWGVAVALFHAVRQRGENGGQNIHAARRYLSNNGVAFEMSLFKAPVCSFYEQKDCCLLMKLVYVTRTAIPVRASGTAL